MQGTEHPGPDPDKHLRACLTLSKMMAMNLKSRVCLSALLDQGQSVNFLKSNDVTLYVFLKRPQSLELVKHSPVEWGMEQSLKIADWIDKGTQGAKFFDGIIPLAQEHLA